MPSVILFLCSDMYTMFMFKPGAMLASFIDTPIPWSIYMGALGLERLGGQLFNRTRKPPERQHLLFTGPSREVTAANLGSVRTPEKPMTWEPAEKTRETPRVSSFTSRANVGPNLAIQTFTSIYIPELPADLLFEVT